MSAATLAFIQAAAQLIPLLVQAGEEIAPFLINIYGAVVGGNDPTDADWASLKSQEDSLRASLQSITE